MSGFSFFTFETWGTIHWVMFGFIAQDFFWKKMITAVEATMLTYVIEGLIIGVLTTPMIVLLLSKKSYRDRKEFLLIAFVAIVDFIYVVVNVINSIDRMYTTTISIQLEECLAQPQFFISLIVTQLVAGMSLMVAFDRLIASFYGVWYYKQSALYTFLILIPPIVIGCFVTSVNSWIVVIYPDQNIKVYSLCFTSTLLAENFKLTFHLTKWVCIALAGIVYVIIALILRHKYFRSKYMTKRLSTANKVMSFTTINSIIFHLFPDIQLAYPFLGSNTIVVQCILYSMILDKIFFNFLLFMIFHKELRQMYLKTFLSRFLPIQSSSGNSQNRMFSLRS